MLKEEVDNPLSPPLGKVAMRVHKAVEEEALRMVKGLAMPIDRKEALIVVGGEELHPFKEGVGEMLCKAKGHKGAQIRLELKG